MQLTDQTIDGLLVSGRHCSLCGSAERVRLGYKVRPELGLIGIVYIFRGWISRIRQGGKSANSVLARHIGKIGVALNDIDDVEHVIVAGPPRVRIRADLIEKFGLERQLANDRVRMNTRQSAELVRVGRHEMGEICLSGIDVGLDGPNVRAIYTANHLVCGVIEYRTDICEGLVRCILRRNSVCEPSRHRLEAGRSPSSR